MSVMTRTVNNAATGWSYDLEFDHPSGNPAPSGLVLKTIRHDGHNFAKDVRLIGIWLKFETYNPASATVTGTSERFVPLDTRYFTAAPIQELNAAATSTPPTADVSMANYIYPGHGLRALYVSTPAVFAGITNCVMHELRITQMWQFSAYGHSPPHEPSGGLHAARFHPITTYRLVLNPSFNDNVPYTRVASIRFDYRLHLTLDRSYSTPDSPSTQPLNHAGLFRDNDVPSGTSLSGSGFSRAAFEAVEKPIAREVIAPGLVNGLSAVDVGAANGLPPRQQISRLWDNVHWWGARTSGHISAPGGFHAAHMHWRWGAPVMGGVPFLLSPPPNIHNFLQPLPQGLNPRDYLANGTIFGALVDPGLWIQTLQVAVTRYDQALDPAHQPLSRLSTSNFRTLFTNRGTPVDVAGGADCVLWYSVEIPRQVTMPVYLPGSSGSPTMQTFRATTGGSVFLHGMFFAHDAERTGRFIGDTAAHYWPRTLATIQSSPIWVRMATY